MYLPGFTVTIFRSHVAKDCKISPLLFEFPSLLNPAEAPWPSSEPYAWVWARLGEVKHRRGCTGAAAEARRSNVLPAGPPGALPAGGPALARPHRAPAPPGLRGRERSAQGRYGCCCQPVRGRVVLGLGQSFIPLPKAQQGDQKVKVLCEPGGTLEGIREMNLQK